MLYFVHSNDFVSYQHFASTSIDDHEWMYTGHPSQAGMTTEWVDKTNEFVEATFSSGKRKTWCPCFDCENHREQSKNTMCLHAEVWA